MRRALSDPALLGAVLAGESWRAWKILLVALMGEALRRARRQTNDRPHPDAGLSSIRLQGFLALAAPPQMVRAIWKDSQILY